MNKMKTFIHWWADRESIGDPRRGVKQANENMIVAILKREDMVKGTEIVQF